MEDMRRSHAISSPTYLTHPSRRCPLCLLQDARSKMLEVLDKAMRAQADERSKKMERLQEKYEAASKKRAADLAKQQKELPAPAFVAVKVG